MATTTTPTLALTLAIPGSNEPFSTAVVNTNFTAIDTEAGVIRTFKNAMDNTVNTTQQTLRLLNSTEASLSSTLHAVQIGNTSGQNLRLDNNEILSVNNGAGASLGVNNEGGGAVIVGAAAGSSPSRVTLAGAPYHTVAPDSVTVSGGTGSVDSGGWTTFSGTGGFVLVNLFDSYTGFDGFEIFIQLTSSPAPGASQPFYVGLHNSSSGSRTTMRSAWRAFTDPAVATFTFGGNSADATDANIGMTGNLAWAETNWHFKVFYPAASGNNTLIQYTGSSVSNGGILVQGYAYNNVAQLDNGFRFGRAGAGTVSGRMYARRIVQA